MRSGDQGTRASGEQRYQQVSGGSIHGCVYLGHCILPQTPLIITKGEFHTLIAWQVGSDFARSATIGSAGHARIDRRWYGPLLGVPLVVACMDADAAGAGPCAQIGALSEAVKFGHAGTHSWLPHGQESSQGFRRNYPHEASAQSS